MVSEWIVVVVVLNQTELEFSGRCVWPSPSSRHWFDVRQKQITVDFFARGQNGHGRNGRWIARRSENKHLSCRFGDPNQLGM